MKLIEMEQWLLQKKVFHIHIDIRCPNIPFLGNTSRKKEYFLLGIAWKTSPRLPPFRATFTSFSAVKNNVLCVWQKYTNYDNDGCNENYNEKCQMVRSLNLNCLLAIRHTIYCFSVLSSFSNSQLLLNTKWILSFSYFLFEFRHRFFLSIFCGMGVLSLNVNCSIVNRRSHYWDKQCPWAHSEGTT